ncbi:hypothetical protein HPB50_025695 [Hyalomma asiaticum]|uniref:Uncharacterized protein n=1 Tax=Hyalomma asiaticum TaxID=266040 RepID=A0ACB7SLE8_HYAAI|nr:hypothetical protein HPB50_025695 [Hyalomma asiaticum]
MAAPTHNMLSTCAEASSALRKPRERFRIDEDLCLLKEVASADPFASPTAWEEVRRNVVRAVQRELMIRAIKERVDLLIGYFREQDTVNLRKCSLSPTSVCAVCVVQCDCLGEASKHNVLVPSLDLAQKSNTASENICLRKFPT